ncbi:MAG TPA: glycosyltransferase 87 family protein, partial [Caulobacter sp.]|nr:glycosyltransferase 87 family protein [Caulobacter sp.]
MDGAGGRKGARLAALLAAGLAIYHLAYLAIYLAKPHPPADPPFSDFYAFWSFGRFLSAHSADRIYDFAALEAFQQSLRPGFTSFYPCVYPPFLLLFLAPLAAADYLPAFAIWTAIGLVGFALAVGARNWRSPLPWLAVLAPTTILTVVAGQNGLITSALLIGGFRLMPRRPWL